MARVNYSGYFFWLDIFKKWTDDTSRIAIIFEERENLKSEKFPDEKFGQSFLTLK